MGRGAAGTARGRSSRPYLLCHDNQPLAYVEVYRVDRDVLATCLPAWPHNLGVHLAIGDVERTGRGFGTAALRILSEGLLRADAACTRVLGDPAADHAVARRAFAAAGFHLLGEVDLPHKRAALFVRSRDGHATGSGPD